MSRILLSVLLVIIVAYLLISVGQMAMDMFVAEVDELLTIPEIK